MTLNLPDDVAPPARAARVVEIVQTVLTALLLALVFRAFFVEPFIIPTGSMAETLLGAHAAYRCPECGRSFDFGPATPAAPTGEGFVLPPQIVCPNCHATTTPTADSCLPRAGDRLLVEKWTYATGLRTPQRWDVIVFRDANSPQQHLIKRAVGLPGESIELRGGDLYINGRIARKPPHVQRELWTLVFDQSLMSADGAASAWPRWRPPDDDHGWTGLRDRVLRHDPAGGSGPLMFAASPATAYFRDMLAYNRRSDEHLVPDLRASFELAPLGDGTLTCTIQRPGPDITLTLTSSGRAELSVRSSEARTLWSATAATPWSHTAAPMQIELAYADGRAWASINDRIVLDSGDALDEVEVDGDPHETIGVEIDAAALACELRALRIDRDVYYSRTSHTRRATPGNPFQLGADEYFVLGDNSADSHDSREWASTHSDGTERFRPGTVRREQIVGQASFVYLPSLLPLNQAGSIRMLDLGRTRFVR